MESEIQKFDREISKINFGRVYRPDERDKGYMLSSIMKARRPGIDYKYWWPSGWWGDQGYTPQCVGYSWTHWLAEGPITQKKSRKISSQGYPIDPSYVYYEAQKVDVWPGENYEGTSVRAGAKILQREGFISSYYWAWDIETVINALLTMGPMVVGTIWKYDMFFPDEDGVITATGPDMGGHAYLLDGINIKREIIRIKNSWGRFWGCKGFAYISFSDMEKLILDRGEACMSAEINK